MPVEEAATIILDAASRQESTVVFPEQSRRWAKLVQADPEFREKTPGKKWRIREITSVA
jgi:hypothetical protein